MRTKTTVAYIFAALLFGSQSLLFAVRPNDFTRSNNSFNKKYSSEKNSLNDKRANLQERGNLEKMKFVTPDNADYLRNQKAYTPDNYNADNLSKERDSRSKMKYDRVPEYAGKTDDWSKSHTELKLDNTDRDLSKKYLGKIDTAKRDLYDQQYLRDHYAEMLELSMQDINKFYFRASHSSDAGIPTQVAGEQIGNPDGEDSASILDFLSKERKIERPTVSLKGPKRQSQDDTSGRGRIPVTQPQDLPKGTNKVMSPSVNKTADTQQPQTNSQKQRSKVAAYEELSPEKAKSFEFMKLPEEMRGETVIKVEVQENDF